MGNVERNKMIFDLFTKYNLGEILEEPEAVTGGFMHKMYCVNTQSHKYAVKEFNPSVMKREGVKENIIQAEHIAAALNEKIPLVSAIPFEDNVLLPSNDLYYMIFDWIDGISIYPPDITVNHCAQIGLLLGKIHTANIQIPGMGKDTNEAPEYNWELYLHLGQEVNAIWVPEIKQIIDQLKTWNMELKKASLVLREEQVLSHRDLDPKNILWFKDKPCIIDWEAAGYVNPYQELIEVINYWTDKGNGELDRNKFEAIYQAYRVSVTNIQVDWYPIITSGFGGMLGWLDYSFKRSLEIDIVSLEEKVLGTEQVLNTIKELIRYTQKMKLLHNWLTDLQ